VSTRSYSDVPNRIINLFLQEAGERYDIARGLAPYRRMTSVLLERFDGVCAYCLQPWEVEDHLVPRNRRAGGLHSWGNVVPACRPCNRAKTDRTWGEHLSAAVRDPTAAETARRRIESYVADFGYNPDTEALIPVLAALYEMADSQSRGLVRFALAATSHQLGALDRASVRADLASAAAAGAVSAPVTRPATSVRVAALKSDPPPSTGG
jgi:hypothetical protein